MALQGRIQDAVSLAVGSAIVREYVAIGREAAGIFKRDTRHKLVEPAY